jgi:hypothetical protein
MNHRSISATLRYYRVGEDRRRDAVDKVTAMAFDRHGRAAGQARVEAARRLRP